MARRYEIPCAFTAAIKSESSGRKMVSTQDFVTQRAKGQQALVTSEYKR